MNKTERLVFWTLAVATITVAAVLLLSACQVPLRTGDIQKISLAKM